MVQVSDVPKTLPSWEEEENIDEAIEGLKKQEEILQLSLFDTERAHEIGEAIRNAVLQNHPNCPNSVIIFIRTVNAVTLYWSAVGNSVTKSDSDVADNMAYMARQDGKSTFLEDRETNKRGKESDKKSGRYSRLGRGGAFPIRVKNIEIGPIGTIVVCGLPTQVDNHDVIVQVLKQFATQ